MDTAQYTGTGYRTSTAGSIPIISGHVVNFNTSVTAPPAYDSVTAGVVEIGES
jgi:hypothetical protein